jgi:hypothetical protein
MLRTKKVVLRDPFPVLIRIQSSRWDFSICQRICVQPPAVASKGEAGESDSLSLQFEPKEHVAEVLEGIKNIAGLLLGDPSAEM